MAISDPVNARWQSWLRRIQLAMLFWLMLSQVAILWVERQPIVSPRFITTMEFLLLAVVAVIASSFFKRRSVLFVVFAIELGALIGAALNGQTAGFELAWLATLARLGLSVPGWLCAIFSLLSVGAFYAVTWSNNELVVQASSGFVQSRGIIGAILGREFLTYLIELLFVNVLVHAIKTEQANRHSVELLTEKLDLISKEVERNRIAREINENVDHLLVELSARAATLSESEVKPETMEPELSIAKELASQSLSRVRESLNLLRKEPGQESS